MRPYTLNLSLWQEKHLGKERNVASPAMSCQNAGGKKKGTQGIRKSTNVFILYNIPYRILEGEAWYHGK